MIDGRRETKIDKRNEMQAISMAGYFWNIRFEKIPENGGHCLDAVGYRDGKEVVQVEFKRRKIHPTEQPNIWLPAGKISIMMKASCPCLFMVWLDLMSEPVYVIVDEVKATRWEYGEINRPGRRVIEWGAFVPMNHFIPISDGTPI